MRRFSFLLPIFFLFFSYSGSASAQYYGWYYNGTYYPSADAACNAHFQKVSATNSLVKSYKIQLNSTGRTVDCRLLNSAGGVMASTTMGLSGDSCENPGATYNPATGRCEDPPPPPSNCAPKAGQNTTWTMQRPDLNGLGNIEYGCEAGCRISLGTSSCQPSSEGATTGVCYGVGTFTGAECQVGDNPTGGNPPTDPDPTDPPPTCGPDHVWSGTACVPKPPEECDPSTGEVCPPGDDGGDDDGDDDGDNDGDDGDSDGKDGDDDGKGDDDGNGNGQCDPATDPNKCAGNGTGNCDPKTDPNQCKGDDDKASVGGEACDAVLTCSGDVIQCAILRKQKEQVCAWDYSKVKSQIESAVSGDSYKLETQTIGLGNSFNEGANGSRWLSSGCPSPRSVSVLGRSFSLSWEPVCNFASSLSYVIVAMAGLFFAVYVGRGLGGQ